MTTSFADDVAMRPADCVGELIDAFSCLDTDELLERLAGSAAVVVGATYAGFVEVDRLQESARAFHVHGPARDPLRVRSWLTESGVLKELAVCSDALALPWDPSVGEPGFLAMPIPLATHDHAFLWVAGRRFCDDDEHLLSRFATAAGRALEAASGMEAAARMLRGVRAFRRG